MRWWRFISAFFPLLSLSVPALSSDLQYAPPVFDNKGLVVPIDIQAVSIHYMFDYGKRQAIGNARISFTMGAQSGQPLLDLIPNVESLKLNGESLPSSYLEEISGPGNESKFRVLRRQVEAGSDNDLEIVFDLKNQVTFADGSVRAGFFMTDLADRQYFEQYGPANMEYDHIAFDFTVDVVGAEKEHVLFSNGDVARQENRWTIRFPNYFTSSSIYFHLSDKDSFTIKETSYEGLASSFPLTIYSRTSSFVDAAYAKALKTLKMLEEKLGPFAHDKLVIYVAGSGGMEYCGATVTGLGALAHELTHSWYARGVMPSNGNAGWIDEAIASWQDNDFRPGTSAPNRAAVNLGNFSPYRRPTTTAAYTEGEALIAELAYLFRDSGGMIPILQSFFNERKHTVISVEDFHRFLERESKQDLQAIFDRYVYGLTNAGYGQPIIVPEKIVADHEIRAKGHPTPYSPKELINLR